MKGLIDKYLRKLSAQGLCQPTEALFIALDDEPYSNKPIRHDTLKVFDLININTILIGLPAEPYRTIVIEVVKQAVDYTKITPSDCETRTFFHDIPIVSDDSPQAIAEALGNRKAAVISDGRVVSCGTVSPEQAFVAFSSVCFSLFVKYFYDNLMAFRDGREVSVNLASILCNIEVPQYNTSLDDPLPPKNHDEAFSHITAAGKAMVGLGLVDSYFGNISCLLNGAIYISQTGSSLDELEQSIDVIPIDGGSTSGITASSEFSAHRAIYQKTGLRFILHGHPKFAVILSMDCREIGCRGDNCYRSCDKKRHLGDSPIVSGEIGTGTYGLLNTVPEAMKSHQSAIVYGHGVFTGSREGFREALRRMVEIEGYCLSEYKRLIRAP